MKARSWQFINHRIHGLLDILVDVTLVLMSAAAWWSGASMIAIALPAVIGAGNLTYSALTRYALGRKHLISFPTHLALDAVAGVVLIAGAAGLQEAPLYRGAALAMGLGILGAVALTDPDVSP